MTRGLLTALGDAIVRTVAILGRLLLGAICGGLLGCALYVMQFRAPVGDSGEDALYSGCSLLLMLMDCAVGVALAAGIEGCFRNSAGRQEALAFSLGGAVLGAVAVRVLGWILHANSPDLDHALDHYGDAAVVSLISQAVGAAGAVAGLFLADYRQGKAGKPSFSNSTCGLGDD
jgi:hypothetical protein